MEKSCLSSSSESTITTTSSGSSTANNTNNRDHYLKHLNKLSHKISKPSSSSTSQNLTQAQLPPPPLNPNQSTLQPQQHQPPVYNIDKNDFMDVVQKLTGSPAHERFSTPPPIQHPKPQSSRLQRIRPPPLVHVTNRPPPMVNCAVPNMNPFGGSTANTFINQRPPATAPLSPLPPFPAVHAAAESPVSAYMRYLQNSTPTAADPNPKQFAGFPPLALLVSPRWNNMTAPQQQPPQQPQVPSSPVPFKCLNSPRSPYVSLFYPNSGQLGFPLSPTVPVPSPKWPSL